MNYTVKGKITEFGEIRKFDSGAVKQTFRIDTGEQYNNILEFEKFEKAENAEKLNNLTKYNKVGDEVEIEFNIKANEWQGKIFTNLAAWRISKASTPTNEAQGQEDEPPF
jgi:hypothetical protein